MVDIDVEDMLKYRDHLSNTEGTGPERLKIEKRLLKLYEFAEKAGNRKLSRKESKIIINGLKKRDRLRRNYPHFNHIEIPQWMLLKSAKVMSVQNFIRKSHMRRLGSILLRGRPVFELDELLEFATDRFYTADGRITTDYPYFKRSLRTKNMTRLESATLKGLTDRIRICSRSGSSSGCTVLLP